LFCAQTGKVVGRLHRQPGVMSVTDDPCYHIEVDVIAGQ
jgi:hypothetical protein